MPLVTPSTNAHWYFPNGKSCHTVPMKTDASRTRDTNLKDARELGLFPSVTNIINMLDKPYLDSWKVEQAIMSALTLPHIEGETIDERAKRVVKDSMQQVDDARKRGHLVHKCIEDFVTGGGWNPHESVQHLADPFKAWFDANVTNVHASELVVVGNGYAGTMDLKASVKGFDGPVILDFKTRKPSQGKMRHYDEDGMQLTAYQHADADMGNLMSENLVSVLINSQEPSEPTIHVWEKEDRNRYWSAFLACFALWKLIKGYEPSLENYRAAKTQNEETVIVAENHPVVQQLRGLEARYAELVDQTRNIAAAPPMNYAEAVETMRRAARPAPAAYPDWVTPRQVANTEWNNVTANF